MNSIVLRVFRRVSCKSACLGSSVTSCSAAVLYFRGSRTILPTLSVCSVSYVWLSNEDLSNLDYIAANNRIINE
jgi:hypothetical protein